MIQSYSRGRFEYFVVATVIALIALVAVDRYALMAKDARVLRLEIISHNFMAGAANARIEFILSGVIKSQQTSEKKLMRNGKTLYFSSEGWPASTTGPANENYLPSNEDCLQLWQLLLQNPDPIDAPFRDSGSAQFQVFAYQSTCRYQLQSGDAWFDYFPEDGRLLFSSYPKS